MQRARKKGSGVRLSVTKSRGYLPVWRCLFLISTPGSTLKRSFNWDTSRRKKMKIPGRSRCLNILKIRWCIDNKSRIIIFITYKISCSYLCFIFISFDHFLVNSDFLHSFWKPCWKIYDRCPCAVERKARIAMFTLWSV